MSVLSAREASLFTALADAVAMPTPPMPPVAATDAVAGFEGWLARAPRANRAAIRLALLGLGTRLRGRDRAGRAAALERLGRSRAPGVAPLVEALRAAAAAAYYGDDGVMRRLGYDAAERVRRGAELRAKREAAAARPAAASLPAAAPPPAAGPPPAAARPAAASPLPGGFVDGASISGERVVVADACVIGSGAGGAVVAKELAEAGMRVVLLEEGAHETAEHFTARPRDMLPRLYRDAAQHATLGRPPILLPLGRAVGGTTLVNSGTCFRTPDHVLARWRSEFGLDDLTPDALAPHVERVERELNVGPVPPELAGVNARIARRGAERLGWSGGFLRRNVRGCAGSGVCAYGCPTNAKQHVGVTYVPKAHAAGATTYTGVRARRIERRGRRATGVEATTAGGGRLRVRTATVIVAAGAIHTPALLARNGLGTDSGQLGRNLSLHPATAVWALMDEPVDMARGVPQSYFVDEFAREGIMLEGIAGPPDYVAMGLPVVGERHRELMARYRDLAQFGLMISDDSRGRVHSLGGRPLVRYDLSHADTARVKAGLQRLAELFWAAGARSVLLPLARCRELHGADSTPLRALAVRPGDLKLMAFHPLGSARMDARATHGVLDGDGRVHGAEGVYVCDGSAIPSSLGVNPQITIMTLATRLAHHLCRS
jgi:choline dehydrogenase-like flavoprotein